MADQLQLRRGTTAQTLLFTGAQGEVTVDTDKNALVVHNGSTAGGFQAATSRQLSDSTFYYNEDAGSASDAYILTPKANTVSPSGYLDGLQFGFVTTHPNTGPSTASFQGLGVRPLKFPGGVDPLAGELSGRVYLIYDAGNSWLEIQRKPGAVQPQIRSISGAVTASSLTATLQPCTIDFRSPTPNNGGVNTRNVSSALTLTVPNGATLGTTNAVLSRIAVLAIYGPVNVELAVVNITAGPNLDETALINTTAISAASTSATVIYSQTARSGVPYRIVGFIDSTQPTAGVWSTTPSLVQGAGGRALESLNVFAGFGFGQTYTDVTGSRVLGTTYTNSTGKPITVAANLVAAGSGATPTYTVAGIALNFTTAASSGLGTTMGFVVPPGATYSIQGGGVTLSKWTELR